MTFEDALNRKKELGETYQLDSKRIGRVWVVPSSVNDLLIYCTEYRVSNFNDNSSKLFSSDSQFKVCAIWTDGINIMKKDL